MYKDIFRAMSLVSCFYLLACDDTADNEQNPDVQSASDSQALADMMADRQDAGPACEPAMGLYDPFVLDIATQYPDNLLTEPDNASPTGLRLTQSYTDFPWMAAAPALLGENFDRWHHLSGFALSGKVFFSFSSPIRADWSDTLATRDDLVLVNLDTGLIDERDFEISWGTGGSTIYLQPQVPLEPGTTYAMFLLRSAGSLPEGCLTPAPVISDLLSGTLGDERFESVQSSYALGLDIAGVEVEEILSATVFTTHRDHEIVLEAATNIKRRRYSWRDGSECESDERLIRCNHQFTARDYRDDGAILTASPTQNYEVPFTTWYPRGFDTPRPILMYGHGLNSELDEAERIVDEFIELGYAIVASPALQHGTHPTRINPDSTAALDFLGIDIGNLRIDAFAMRGHFNQTSLDRLQILELIRQTESLPGAPDQLIDASLSVYFGISLGGLLGPVLLASDDAIDAGILSVAGGRLIAFATDTESVDMFRPVLVNLAGGDENLEKMLAVAQTFVDAADPATFARHVLYDRLDATSRAPDLLVPVAEYDEVVPPSTGRALARALRIPHVAPVSTPVEGLEVIEAPVQGNHPDGTSTQGYFQFDRLPRGDGSRTARHSSTPSSEIALFQVRAFLSAISERMPALIINPYAEFDVPALMD